MVDEASDGCRWIREDGHESVDRVWRGDRDDISLLLQIKQSLNQSSTQEKLIWAEYPRSLRIQQFAMSMLCDRLRYYCIVSMVTMIVVSVCRYC